MNMDQDRQMQMVGGNGGNQFRQYIGQNAGNLARNENQNQNGNGNLVAARAERNAAGQNRNQIRNCIVRPRRRDAAYLQTHLFSRQKTGSESRPLMLNKENYVPWSSRLLRYAKSRSNGKLIHNSILNGPYVRKMIPEPGDANREITVTETFHLQTDDEL
nr:hypothetical protein [Tanacetum cinerariifolium]